MNVYLAATGIATLGGLLMGSFGMWWLLHRDEGWSHSRNLGIIGLVLFIGGYAVMFSTMVVR